MVSFKTIMLATLSALATVNAVADSEWQMVGGSMKQLSYDGKTLCGTNDAKEVWCARNADAEPNWEMVNGTFKWVAVSGNKLWGVSINNAVWAYEFAPSDGLSPRWQPLEGRLRGGLQKIATDGSTVCGITYNYDLYCADANQWSLAWKQIPGRYSQVDLKDGSLYATGYDGSIWYGLAADRTELTQADGNLKLIVFDGAALCGLDIYGNVWCSDTDTRPPAGWHKVESQPFDQLAFAAGSLYAITSDGRVYYKSFMPKQPELPGWDRVDDHLVQIDFDGKTACGVTELGKIYCSDENVNWLEWRYVPGELTQVVVWGDHLFGLDSDHQVYSGNTHGDPKWRKIGGWFQQISTDGKQICGTSPDNTIWCTDAKLTVWPTWRQVDGSLKHAVVVHSVIFGTDQDDNVWLGRSHGDPKWKKINGSLRNLSYDGLRICGTNSKDEVYCSQGDLASGWPHWNFMGNGLLYVTVSGEHLFGLAKSSGTYHRTDV